MKIYNYRTASCDDPKFLILLVRPLERRALNEITIRTLSHLNHNLANYPYNFL